MKEDEGLFSIQVNEDLYNVKSNSPLSKLRGTCTL
jgi:hypothetical protein